MSKRFIQSADVDINDRGSISVSLAGSIVLQGEKAVGAATVQLVATPTPCSRVWIGAPTASHTRAAQNTGTILVGKGPNTAANKSGGIPLANDNAAGFFYPCEDASGVYLTGFAAGDVVEYQVFR